MVVHEYPHIVGIRDDTVGHMRSGTLSMDVDAGATERGVGDVTVVY